ncbi:hypothetical protein MXD62_16445 [Frankia sp. Mgl5]|uniref:hypothetical protein n=1 Tax=Frankia sp. Mgl5 TaxID=2933793 RepID=UPI00200F13F5|nr:hypothetical protein [Frankia sp. Mgl5]MCK9928746.1 hypothetical protein [Frankia sp. Mgl5]
MFELSKVRLHSIGPPGARFGDVLLDFSGVGAPVTGHRQDALFSAGVAVPETDGNSEDTAQRAGGAPPSDGSTPSPRTPGAVAAGGVTDTAVPAVQPGQAGQSSRPVRPSPASVLFLENGGGKSVLMKLIFSVVLPGRRQVVGTSNGRVLDNFVLARDCGHVVCEWQHAVTGERVVTGKVSEWRGRATGDASRLAEAWYSFRPSAELDIASLPLVRDGRLITLAGFRTRLAEAGAADPKLAMTWETNQGAWSENLDAIGLDPELFRYQRAMNAGEGEAAEAFAFNSDEQFVDFLLRAVTPPEDPAGVAEVVDGYAAKLAERAALDAEREFVAGALERLNPLVEAVGARVESAAGLRALLTTVRGAAGAVEARIALDRVGAVELGARGQSGRDAVEEAERARRRAVDIELAARLRVAELRLAEAEATRDELVERFAEANEELDAWRAAEDVLRHAAASSEAERLTRLVEEAESRSAPALADRAAAARALGGGWPRRAAAAVAEERRARAAAAAHELAAAAAAAADRAAADGAATARAGAAALRERRARSARVLAEAVRDGLLPSADIDPRSAAAEAARAAEEARAAVQDALAAATRSTDRERAQDGARAAERELDTARAELTRLTSELEQALAGARALTADGRIAALLGLGTGPDKPDQLDAAHHLDAVNLDTDAPAALDALAAAVLAAEERQLALSVDAEADLRVLNALGDGDLRPARPAVGDVLAVLTRAGIPAVSGWQHLSRAVAATERERVLAARPDLVDGVVVPAGWDVGAAHAALAAARLLPDCAIVVGAAELLSDAASPSHTDHAHHIDRPDNADLAGPLRGRAFLVPPNPALYDRAAAAAERESVRRRHEERSAQAAELSARARADRELAAAVAGWRRSNPPGRVAGLRAAARAGQDAVDVAENALAAARELVGEAVRAAERAVAEVERLRAVEEERTARAAALDLLVRAVGESVGADSEITRLEATAAERSTEAEEHRARAAAARAAAQDALRRADDAARNARVARAESAEVVGGGDIDSADVDSGDINTDVHGADGAGDGHGAGPGAGGPPQVPLLRAVYESAERAYAQVEVGADLRGELDRARRAQAAARGAVEGLPAAVRTRSAALLAGPNGGDAAARATAQAASRRVAADLGRELDAARERLGGLRQELRHTAAEVADAGARPLARDEGPTTMEQSRDAHRAAVEALHESEAAVRAARAALDELERHAAAHEREVDAFGLVTETLSELRADAESAVAGTSERAGAGERSDTGVGERADADAGGRAGIDAGDATSTSVGRGDGAVAAPAGSAGWPGGVEAFDGDTAAATAMARELRSSWRQAVAAHGEAAGRVRAAADAVAAWAATDRFESVRSPARRQMVRAGRDAVAANAADWAAALAPRLRSLDDDLAHIGRNRAAIVARLEGMVRASLGTLRSAQRLSRLPDRLGDWSGQEFLRITFAEPDPVALTDALGEVVDAAARGSATSGPASTGTVAGSPGGPGTAGARRDGMTLLLRGVRAALPGGVRVEILKPDAVLRTERVRVSQLGDVFSGGQQLTAAIILYCTMAALRANDRGRLRARHAGVLFLDNPIGRASAAYLLDLQLAVADRLGVQLIYTTGLFDTTALSAFTLVIRLRNDADLRAGMKYLRVQERLRPGLTPPDVAAGGAAGVITASRLFRRTAPGPPATASVPATRSAPAGTGREAIAATNGDRSGPAAANAHTGP